MYSTKSPRRRNRYEEAVRHFERFFRRTAAPTTEDLWLLGSEREAFASQTQSDSLLPPDLFSYTHLLSALEKLGRDRSCLAALEEMQRRGVKVIYLSSSFFLFSCFPLFSLVFFVSFLFPPFLFSSFSFFPFSPCVPLSWCLYLSPSVHFLSSRVFLFHFIPCSLRFSLFHSGSWKFQTRSTINYGYTTVFYITRTKVMFFHSRLWP